MNTFTCKNYFQTVDIKLEISLTTSPSPTPPARVTAIMCLVDFLSDIFSVNLYASVEIHGIALGQFYRFVCWWSVAFTQFISYCLDITASCLFFFSPTESLWEFPKLIHQILCYGHHWELQLSRGDKGCEGNPREVMTATEHHFTIAFGWTVSLFLIAYQAGLQWTSLCKVQILS